jgi:outer membrane protein OmpU
MKKILFATTAMATAGMIAGGAGDAAAAERIAIEVHGFHQQWIVGLDQDFTDTDAGRVDRGFKAESVDQKTNSEICFTGQTTLDNGISVGLQVELEAQAVGAAGLHIDETFLFLESERMGQFKLGVEDSVADLLHVGPPNGGVSVDDGDVVNVGMYVNTALAQSVVLSSTSLGDLSTPGGIRNGDANRIMYTTPRYAGFQAGISYAPQAAEDSDANNNANYGLLNQNGRYHDSVEAGLNYREAFGGVGVQLSGGVRHMNQRQDLSAFAGVDPGTMFGYSMGGQLTFGGLTVGGAFRKITSGRDTPLVGTTTIADQRSLQSSVWSAGARYEIGPYAAGLSCISGEAVGWQAAGTGDLEHFNCAVSGTYTLGPGIRLIGGLFLFDDEAETPAGPAAVPISNTSDTDGWGGTIALTASF